jgi:hypothetical protein
MRIKQPKMSFPDRNERRPKQDIPTEAARIKARLARMPARPDEDSGAATAGRNPKPK